MAFRSYNPSCRIGNWEEDVAASEAEIQEFLRKQAAGELVSQTIGQKLGCASEPSSLSSLSGHGYLRFGDRILLRHIASKGSVSVLPTPYPTMSSEIPVTATPNGAPMHRTVFKIELVNESIHSEGDIVKFGDRFRLHCTIPGLGNLYLLSEKFGLHSVPSRFAKQQKVYSENVEDKSQLTHDADWEFLYHNAALRFEHEGQPVPGNGPVLLRHVRSGMCLAVLEKYIWRTEYGNQFEVSAHTHLDAHRIESSENMLEVVLEESQAQIADS